MTLIELFGVLSTRGLRLTRLGEELQCRGDQSQVSDDLKEALREHREAFLRCVPDSTEIIRGRLSCLVEWLNEAAPVEYKLEEEFWCSFDRQLEAAVETGDVDHLDAEIDRLKHLAVAHFLPFHTLPEPGETLVTFPGHELLDFTWEREAIMSVERGAVVDDEFP